VSAALSSSLTTAIYSYVLMAVIAILCAGLIKLIVGALARTTKTAPAVAVARPSPKAPAPAALPFDDTSDDLAVIIAAACHAAIGAHRIVYVAETPRAANWTTEVRARHHQSHLPHR
jgi:hypothetical protein